MNNTMRRTSGGNGVQGGSEIGPSVSGEATPWGERQRHQQVDDAAKGEWIDVQKKAFTRWCNSHLKQRGMDIKDLFEDLHDGQLLLNLLEIIGGDSVFSICKRKWNTKPKMRIHELENCNLIFEYLKAKELQLTNIGSTDLVDKNSKLILGLIWTIILRFAIAEDGKQGLLLWARRSVEGYGIDIDNFDFSWKDGRAFLALINKYRPDVLDYNATVSSDPRSNVATAFRVAAEQLGIDQLLDVEDLVDSARPDEKSVIAYVSMFFNKFASLARKQALIDSIIKAVALTRKHDGLIFKYKYSAKQIKDWIAENTARFKAADTSRSTAEVKAKIDALQDYRKETKPSQKAVLLELSSILGQLRTSQRSNGRPLFSPEEPLSDKTIEGEWNALEAAESAYEQMLIEKYAAFTVMDYEVSKVTAKLNKLEPWLESRSTCFDTTDYGNSISSAEQKLSSYEAFAAQAEVYGALLSQSQTLASSLSDEHGQVMSAKHRLQAATTLYQKIKAAGEAYKSKVEERLALERELVASTLKYGALTNEVNFVLDEVDEALTAPILGNSEDEVEAMKHTLAGVVDKFNSLAPKVDEIKAIAKTVTAHGREAALEIPVGPLVATYDKLSGSIHAREAELDKALANTKAKVQARKAFAAAAEDLNAYIQETSDASMFNNRRASLDVNAITTTLQQLKEGYKTTGKSKLAAVEEASAKQEALAVVANGFTVQTIYSLRTAFEELGKLLDARLDAHLAALAAIRSQSALSEEQWKEVNKVFSALDKDRDGSLSLKEFKDGIQGLGIVVNDSDADRQFLSLCKASPGHLTLPEFGDFMLAQLKAGSSLEDIINAFKTISGGETISQTTITTLFVKDDYADYLLTHMPAKGDGYAYVPFVHDIFKR